MSQRALTEKSRIKTGDRIAAIYPTESYLQRLIDLPEKVTLLQHLKNEPDLVHACFIRRKDLEQEILALKSSLAKKSNRLDFLPKKECQDRKRSQSDEIRAALGA